MPFHEGRTGRAPTLMKIFGASSDLAVHLDRMRPGEARVAPDEAQVLRPGDPLVQAIDRLPDDGVLARLHRLHVDADRTDADAVVGGAPGNVRGAGARHQRLGRDAAVVDAGAAEVLALDQRRLHAGLGQADGEGRSGLAAADDDRVVASAHAWVPPWASRSSSPQAAEFASQASRYDPGPVTASSR